MNIEPLLPRPLDPQSGLECSTILGAMLTASHFERTKARALGWRGILPSASEIPGWTCKLAGSPHIFGLVFAGERVVDEKYIEGIFHTYVFPSSDSQILERFSLAALHQAMDDNYKGLIRQVGAHETELQSFLLGRLHMKISLDKDALSISLICPDHQRIIALDGVQAGNGQWIIAPGEYDCDVPAFRLLTRLFSAIVATAESQVQETAAYWLSKKPASAQGVDSAGRLYPYPEQSVQIIHLTATFGAATAPTEARPLRRLPLRHRPTIREDPTRPVLHVLTGFLGAGKTTFLRHWLDFLHGRERYTGVIQNEFGAINVDAALLRGSTGVEALEDGCVCCSLADSLRPGLERLISSMPAQQIILETTGLANPETLVETLHLLNDLIVPGLIVTVLDVCSLGQKDFAGEEIRRAQIEKANVLVLSKGDLCPPQRMHDHVIHAAELNPNALVLCADNGHAAFAELDAWLEVCGGYAQQKLSFPLKHTQGHEKSHIAAHTVKLPAEVSRKDIEEIITLAGPGLLRAKGMVMLKGEGPRMVQYVPGRLNFEDVPERTQPGNLILIGAGMMLPGKPQ